MLRGLLLDLDGTLVDTPQAIVEVTQATLAALGLPPADVEEIRRGIGLPLPVALAGLMGKGPVGASEAVGIYRTLWHARVTPRLPHLLYPGVLEGVARLKQAGLRLAVVTGKAQEGADATVDLSGLRPFMDAVLGYTSVPNPKPAPDLALAALRRLQVAAEEAAVVGDTALDLQMARAAGVRAIAVTYGAQPASELRREAPAFEAHSFAEVVRLALGGITVSGP